MKAGPSFRALSFIALFALAVPLALAQPVPATKSLTFDVVSVRPSKPGTQQSGRVIPDGFIENGQDLWTLIMTAYFPQGMAYWSHDRLKGTPSWISDAYDIDARVAPADLAEWRAHPNWPNPVLGAALQALLADRFKLAVHRVHTTMPGQALVVAKHGPQLKPSPANEQLPTGMKLVSGGVSSREDGGRVVHFYAATMDDLTERLSMLSIPRKPIENHTGLTGKYDFTIRQADPVPSASGSDSSGPGLSWDLHTLGLNLKEVDLPADTVVIDHIERPSAN